MSALVEATNVLNSLEFVRWDRFVQDGLGRDCYGWIYAPCTACYGEGKRWPRGVDPLDPQNEPEVCLECEGEGLDRTLRADFLLLRLGADGAPLSFWTSSAERSEQISEILWGPGQEHLPCKRIEDAFPDVRNAVRL